LQFPILLCFSNIKYSFVFKSCAFNYTLHTDTCFCSFLSWMKQTDSWMSVFRRNWKLSSGAYQKTGKTCSFQQPWLVICKRCVTIIKVTCTCMLSRLRKGFKLPEHLKIDEVWLEDCLIMLALELHFYLILLCAKDAFFIDLCGLSVLLNACLDSLFVDSLTAMFFYFNVYVVISFELSCISSVLFHLFG